jgi:hypothetical protein
MRVTDVFYMDKKNIDYEFKTWGIQSKFHF